MLKSIKVFVAVSFMIFIFLPLAGWSYSHQGETGLSTATVTEEFYLFHGLVGKNTTNEVMPLMVFLLPFVLVFAKDYSVSSRQGYYFFSLVELAGLGIFTSYLYQLFFVSQFKLTLFGNLLVVLSAGYAILIILEVLQIATRKSDGQPA